MEQPYYWWHACSYFNGGENNGPHVGQVIKHYRKMSGTSNADLAAAFHCTTRYIGDDGKRQKSLNAGAYFPAQTTRTTIADPTSAAGAVIARRRQ